MKHYIGIIIAIFVASLLLTPQLAKWLFSDNPENAEYATAFVLSMLIMSISNIGSIVFQKSSQQAKITAEKLYDSVGENLYPILNNTLNDKINKGADQIIKSHKQKLHFYILIFYNDFWRVFASTQNESSQTWNLELGNDEGVVGFTAQEKAEFITKIDEDGNGQILDKHNSKWGGPKKLSNNNKARVDKGIKYVYSTPLLGTTSFNKNNKDFLGVLTVDSYSDSGMELMDNIELREKILSLGTDLVPYLRVIKEMINMEK